MARGDLVKKAMADIGLNGQSASTDINDLARRVAWDAIYHVRDASKSRAYKKVCAEIAKIESNRRYRALQKQMEQYTGKLQVLYAKRMLIAESEMRKRMDGQSAPSLASVTLGHSGVYPVILPSASAPQQKA